MKRFVLILLAVCLLLGCIVGYVAAKSGAGDTEAPAEVSEPEPVIAPTASEAEETEEVTGQASQEPEAVPFRGIDYEAIRALHEPDEIAGDVDGREVTWNEYFYWLHSMGVQAEQYIQTLAMYGQSISWTDKLNADSEQTFAEYVIELAQDSVIQLNTVEAVAEESGAVLTAENEAELAEQLKEAIVSVCGEGASEEDFNARLEQEYVSREMYDRINRANYLFQNTFDALYGRDGADVSEETALAFLEEKGYLGAAHILFATVDLNTFEPLDDAVIEQKLQQAESVSAELRGIKDVSERASRFAELKEQYCEDTGKTTFPDGYLFTSGTMVPEFEDGVNALEEYEVSEPILSSFGYHVIMRLPLSAEMTMDYSEAGTPLTARALYANEEFNKLMTGRLEESVFTLLDGFELDLTEYLK